MVQQAVRMTVKNVKEVKVYRNTDNSGWYERPLKSMQFFETAYIVELKCDSVLGVYKFDTFVEYSIGDELEFLQPESWLEKLTSEHLEIVSGIGPEYIKFKSVQRCPEVIKELA